MGFLPTSVVFLLAVGGGVAFALGARRTGMALLMPAAWRWVVAPVLSPALAGLGWPTLALLGLVALICVPFAAILLLQRAVEAIYGPYTASKVSGTYLVRLLDGLGRVIAAMLTLLFRLVARALSRRNQ